MIRLVYSKQRLWNGYQAAWCLLSFLNVNVLFFYIVLKVSFLQFVPALPLPLSFIMLLFLLADSLYVPFVTKRLKKRWWVVDLIVWVLVTLSLYIPNQSVTSYLGLAITIRISDVLYIKEMLFDLVKRRYWLYKIYIIAKIVYWMLIFGHVSGCIFYALEMYLLNNQMFGAYQLNPLNYYQGQLLAYTPIYMFENLNRYVYAIYFTFALISTIAFGDIIGKNYIEDIYVMFLIIMATIGIALIVEQMYIIFRRKKTLYLELLNEVRFLSQRLKQYDQIPRQFRLQIINYLIEANWRYRNEQPTDLEKTPELKTKLIKQSLIVNPSLPVFFSKYLLHKLDMTNFPAGIQISSNVKSNIHSYLENKFVQGTYWIGYCLHNGKLAGGYEASQEGMSFGIEEALVATNGLYPWLCVRTVTFGVVMTITHNAMHQILHQLESIQFPFDQPAEHFQIAKNQALFNRQKYKCSICETTNHTLLTCPKCHYVINNQKLISLVNRSHERQPSRRKLTKSHKINNIYLHHCEEQPEQSYRMKQIRRLKDMLHQLRSEDYRNQKVLEHWHKWAIYENEGLPVHQADQIQ